LACVFVLSFGLCFALIGGYNVGRWPNSWPKELELYRKQAKTIEIAAGNQENVYEIRFENREEFEKLWPTILKLKDKGAPLRLCKIEKPFKEGRLFNNEKPLVRIFSYVCPAWPVHRAGGKELRPTAPPWPDSIKSLTGELPQYMELRPAPPWPDSIKSPTGELPEYVTISQDGNTWVPVEEKKFAGFMYRARTEIELVVDGTIIDLNHVPLPAGTPIIDKRFEKK